MGKRRDSERATEIEAQIESGIYKIPFERLMRFGVIRESSWGWRIPKKCGSIWTDWAISRPIILNLIHAVPLFLSHTQNLML